MRGLYIVQVVMGVILIGVLVAVYNARDEKMGRSGTIASVPSGRGAPESLLPLRNESVPLTFTNHLGEKTSDLDFRGHFSLVFFGYSSCPDVCPGNLVAMSRALTMLGAFGEAVLPIFISFDPARDTPEILKEYVAHFHPRLIGLTGSQEEIEAATKAYGVFFELSSATGATADAASEIQHTSNTYLLGPDGKAVEIFPHSTEPRVMAAKMGAHLTMEAKKAEAVRATALP